MQKIMLTIIYFDVRHLKLVTIPPNIFINI
jgi:hypothetical protein